MTGECVTYDQNSDSSLSILQSDSFALASSADDIDEEDGHRRVQDDLKNRIDDDEDCAELTVATGKLVPYHDHGDTSCQPNENNACTVGW